MKKVKVAVVHDWLVTDAGAEKVLKEILEIFPDADIFSLVDFLTPRDREAILSGKRAKTSFIQKLPFAKEQFRNYLPLFPKAIESLDLRGYDLVLSSSWAVAKGVKSPKKQLHISYCHTPIRYAWDLYEEYTSTLTQPKRFLVDLTLKYIRKWDIETLDRVDFFVANSNFVQERIKRTYKRDSKVIYPPVDVEKFTLKTQKDDFFLTASRLVAYKKTKLIVQAFNQMPKKKLVVIGNGEELESIKSIANKNIEILGYQSDEILVDFMQRAKGFVYGAVEDFGIIPVEAQACGTPVIALNRGGTAESVVDGVTGIHFTKQRVEDIIEAVEKFEQKEFDYRRVREFSKSFSKDIFHKNMREFVEEKLNSFYG